MSTQPKPQVEVTESDLVGELTDKAINRRINALERAVETRRTAMTELLNEISERITERDELLDEQVRRLQARRTRPVEARAGEKTDRDQPGSRCRECGDTTFSCEHWTGGKE